MYIVLYIYSKPFPYGYMESDSPKRIGKRVTKIGFVVSGPEAMPCARMSRPMAMMGIRMTWRMMKMTKHGTCWCLWRWRLDGHHRHYSLLRLSLLLRVAKSLPARIPSPDWPKASDITTARATTLRCWPLLLLGATWPGQFTHSRRNNTHPTQYLHPKKGQRSNVFISSSSLSLKPFKTNNIYCWIFIFIGRG